MESNTLELSQNDYRFLEVILDKIKLSPRHAHPLPPNVMNQDSLTQI